MNSHIHVKIVIKDRMDGGWGLQIFVILFVVKWSIYISVLQGEIITTY